MIDLDQATRDVEHWIDNFVSVGHPQLNGFAPCPFAKKAWYDHRVEVRDGHTASLDHFAQLEIDGNDVIVYAFDPDLISHDFFDALCDEINQRCLEPRGLIGLSDHPAYPESVGGCVMNQGRWALILIAEIAKLDSAARYLHKKGYYNNWPNHYLKDVFRGRADPRTA